MITTLIACLLATFFAVFKLSFAVGQGFGAAQILVDGLTNTLWFLGFCWCFCSIVGFPLTLFHCFFSRSREIWLVENQLHARIGDFQNLLDLTECYWVQFGKFSNDNYGFYMGETRPRLAVRQHKKIVSLGFTDLAAEKWISLLRSKGVPERKRIPWLLYLFMMIPTSILGGAFGLTIERLLGNLGVKLADPGVLVFIGALDASMLLLFFVGGRYRMNRVSPLMISIQAGGLFGCIAYIWGGHDYWVYGCNALIGGIGAWLILMTASKEPLSI